MPKYDREERRLQVCSFSLMHCILCQVVAHKFLGSHMTCKKCKHEFCWVCMGNRQDPLYLPFC